MMLTAGAEGSFETARHGPVPAVSIFNATGDMRGLRGTAQHLTGLEIVRDAAGDSAEAANRYKNLLSFRSSKEAYSNLSKKGINLAHVCRDAAKRGEDMNLAFVGAIQGAWWNATRNTSASKRNCREPRAHGPTRYATRWVPSRTAFSPRSSGTCRLVKVPSPWKKPGEAVTARSTLVSPTSPRP